MIDYQRMEFAQLLPQTTPDQIQALCEKSIEKKVSSVCISPYFIPNCRQHFQDYKPKIVTCIGYPYGFSITSSKVEEIKRAINFGADEFDMVLNISAIKSDNISYLKNDIDSCIRISHLHGKALNIVLKFEIIESNEMDKIIDIINKYEVGYLNLHLNDTVDINTISKVREKLVAPLQLKITGNFEESQLPSLLTKCDLVSSFNY